MLAGHPDVEAQSPTAPAPVAGGDLEQVNLCDLVLPQEGAGAFAAEPRQPGGRQRARLHPLVHARNRHHGLLRVGVAGREDLAGVSLSQARDVGAEPVAGLAAESLIQYVDDDVQFRLTGMGRDDFGFEIAALEERGPSGVSG